MSSRLRAAPSELLPLHEEEEDGDGDGAGTSSASVEEESPKATRSATVVSPTSPRSARSASSTLTFSNVPAKGGLQDFFPCSPWCGKCVPLPPEGGLPVKPEQLILGSVSSLKVLTDSLQEVGHVITSPKRASARAAFEKPPPVAEEEEEQEYNPEEPVQERLEGGEAAVKFHTRSPRVEQLAERLQLTANHPTTFSQRTVDTPEEVELLPSMLRSRFSQEPFRGFDVQMNPSDSSGSDTDDSDASSDESRPDVPPLLTKFTTEQVSRMELVQLAHVKMQIMKERTRKEGVQSIRARKTTFTTKFASLWQLLKKRQAATITEQENYFLTSQLRYLPFFQDVPAELYEKIIDETTTQSYVPGCYLFREGDEAHSLYLVITGEVQLRSEGYAMARDARKSAPALLLQDDLFMTGRDDGQPYYLRRKEDRIRSQTALAAAGTTVAFIFSPAALAIVSEHHRVKEAEDRAHIVRYFARTLRLSRQVCAKYKDIFEVKTFPRSYLFTHAGHKPRLEDASLYFVVKGELQAVQLPRQGKLGRRYGKAKKEEVGQGFLIGEAALYGEAYPSAVVSSSDVKVLAIKVTDYLQKLLNRSSVLPRPEGYTEPEGPSEAASMRGRRQLIKDTTAFVAKTVRLKEDKKNMQDAEWKKATWRSIPAKIPPGGLHKLHAMATNQEGRIPEEEIDSLDLQRLKVPIVADVGRSGDGYLTRSMNKQLSSNTARVRQLEAAHRSHRDYHYHVEDITGSPLPAARLLCVSPGSRMLMALGSMSPRPRSSPGKAGRNLRQCTPSDRGSSPGT